MASLEGKVIAVTGAASGIAKATSKILYERGASLSLADLNGDSLDAVAAELRASSKSPQQKVTTTVLDVRKSHQVTSWIEQTVKVHERLDGACNLAGVVTSHSLLGDTTDETFDFVMGVNVTGIFNCLRAEINNMPSGGSIVSAASVCGLVSFAKMSPYVASKHAVIGLTKTAAKEYGPRGVRVNCVAPGLIDTPMTQNPEFRANVSVPLDGIPLRRQAAPEEVGKLIAFLLSDDASYISGSVYNVDAGLLC